jgi:hypothetical protein
MRSLNLRRAAVVAALAFTECLCLYFAPAGLMGMPWVLGQVVVRWINAGLLMTPVLACLTMIAFGVRMLARQHVRAGGADPLEGVRRRVAQRRWSVRAFLAAVGLGWMGMFLPALELPRDPLLAGSVLLGGVVLPALAIVLALRTFGRMALAPLLHPGEVVRTDADGYLFSAVAVTGESRAAVGLLAALTVGMGALFATSTSLIFTSTGPAVLLAYGVVASLVAYAFQSTSRIEIGLDGVRVRGSSRSRFHAYRDIDAVEVARGGDVVLLRRGRAVLRLQLHGEDVARRGPIVERLRAAIARAHAPEAVAQRFAEAATPAVLAQAARGDGDYRSPAAGRDALWEVVEAPPARGETRVRAARALADGADGADRARLRIAAERCAEPEARQGLARIAALGEDDEEEAGAPAPRRAALQVEKQ